MTHDEMIEKLKLTPEQQKAFNRMKKALKDFEKAGGMLLGNNDCQYALNGKNVAGHEDYYKHEADENISIRLDDTENEYLNISDPYNDASPWVIVK
ncbi:hypothetical protein A323_gp13 [Acinetobacter phage AP22]|uniref:Uncharacterized protein n=1 Tax=Acinetobacter phage AP22 TaxID=1187128 RepID=I2GUC0_9CAUD|nr:hypothetical protein A323_gp13 [Acinetobacter phage AP22]CCH57721.1 hypothetical protein [Acinetobacter phage AP22]